MKCSLFALVLASALLAASCGGAYVGGGYYYADTPPPPVRAEVFGTAPGPGYVWIRGNWNYTGGRYNWAPGRWERPPHGRTHWEAGRWEKHGSQYHFREGHWR